MLGTKLIVLIITIYPPKILFFADFIHFYTLGKAFSPPLYVFFTFFIIILHFESNEY